MRWQRVILMTNNRRPAETERHVSLDERHNSGLRKRPNQLQHQFHKAEVFHISRRGSSRRILKSIRVELDG